MMHKINETENFVFLFIVFKLKYDWNFNIAINRYRTMFYYNGQSIM